MNTNNKDFPEEIIEGMESVETEPFVPFRTIN